MKYNFLILILIYIFCACNNKNQLSKSNTNISSQKFDSGIKKSSPVKSKDEENIKNNFVDALEIFKKNYFEQTSYSAENQLDKGSLNKLDASINSLKENLNSFSKENKFDQSKDYLQNFLFEFLLEIQHEKIKNQFNKNQDEIRFNNSQSIEEYLNLIFNTKWKEYINENLRDSTSNILKSAISALQNNESSFKDVVYSIKLLHNFIKQALDLMQTDQFKNNFYRKIFNQNKSTKYQQLIKLAVNKFQNIIIKPLENGLSKVLSSKNNLNSKNNCKKSVSKIKNAFLKYKSAVESYIKIDPEGKNIKNLINSLQDSDKNNFKISNHMFNLILSGIELKSTLVVISKKIFNQKPNHDKVETQQDKDWDEVINKLMTLVTISSKINKAKLLLKNLKSKLLKIRDKNKYNQIKQMINVAEKEQNLVLLMISELMKNKILFTNSYLN